jgi:hypothetical protein
VADPTGTVASRGGEAVSAGMRMTQDDLGTHLDWAHDGITPRMIDWFWSNMEKGFLLWHPEEHEPLTWAVPPRPGDHVGAVHLAPQTWSDGTFRNLYIRFEDPAAVPAEVAGVVVHDHCVIVAGLGFGPESLEVEEPLGYRVHQWQATDFGVVGRSSGIGRAKPESHAEGRVWAKHCEEEIGNWGRFLPQLYALYRVVLNPAHNPYTDLTVQRDGATLRYTHVAPAAEVRSPR